MGCLEIKEKLLRCEKCFMLKLFLIKPDYPQTTLICKCSCGMFSIPLLSFTKALQAPLSFKIICSFCGKEPKHPLYCPGCRKIYCNTCKYDHNTEIKSKIKHNLIDAYKYDFYCAEDQDVFNNAYCDDCKLDICNKCIQEKLHIGHIVYMYSQLQLNKNDEKKTKNDIEASAEKIIKKINMSKVLIKQLSNKEQIDNLKEVVNTTMMDNKSIIALIQFFYQMYIRAKHKNYALIHNIKENMKFNLFPFQIPQSNNLDERLNDFLEYLKSDFVLFKRIISTKKKQKAKDKKEKNNNEKSENQEKINNINNNSDTLNEDNILMNINENKEIESNININNELEEKKDMNMNENDNDDLINEDITEIKEEEVNIDKQNYINNNRNNSEDVAIRKRAISIFDINKIIKEKYDDAIFKEDSEEVNIDIKPELHKSQKFSNKELNKLDEPTEEIKNNNEDKELIIESNNSKEEKPQIVSNDDNNQNLLNNTEEVKEMNLNDNSNEIKDDTNIEKKEEQEEIKEIEEKKENDKNIIIEQDKEEEQDKEQEKPSIEEKIFDKEIKNESNEEHKEKEDNNQNNIKINTQNDNNINNIRNEKDNNEINKQDEKAKVDKVIAIEEKNSEEIKNNKEIKTEENIIEEKKKVKKDDKKEVKKEDKNITKKEPQKSENKLPPRKVSGFQAKMNIFEKKANNNTNTTKPDFKKQLAKKTITAGILSNPKFSNLAKMINAKMPHGPAPKKENIPEKPNIVSERVDANTLLMNIPIVSKKNVKKKPKKIVFE